MIRRALHWLANRALAVHRRLLPAEIGVGWTPYLWLFYLGFFIWWGVARQVEPELVWLTVAIFLPIYFNGYWCSGRRLLWNIALIEALGVVWAPSNPGATTFFIFGAGFCGAVGPPRQGARVLAAILVLCWACAWALDLSWVWMTVTAIISFMVGATNIFFADSARKNADLRRSRDEAERLAAMAERERIARDLHDLLGHTLSVVTLKAELAGKLARREDPALLPRIAEEILDVERVSRDALRQVREAVAGFRDIGLAGELARARLACDARGIAFAVITDPDVSDRTLARALGPRREAALALVLREAVTNVVRHSRATTCTVGLEQEGEMVRLSVVDDGRGGAPSATGSGLAGMRERLAELGGHLDVDGRDGWRLVAHLQAEAVPKDRPNRRLATDLAAEGAGS